MRRVLPLLTALLVSAMVLAAPFSAEARLGSGQSFGSRGSRTWSAPSTTSTSPYGAAPMQRSTTVPGSSSYGSGLNGFGTSGYGGSGLRSGLLGGLLGFGLGSAMFGHGYGFGFHRFGFGGGGFGGGGFGMLGFLLRILILFFVVRWVLRRFFGGRGGMRRGGMGMFAPRMATMPGYGAPAAVPLAAPVAIQPADFNAFEGILKNIQAAWSNADINGIRRMATPEMVSYFAEQLSDYSSRGQRNAVNDVRLVKGDLAEAWAEDGRTYATVAMRFSMLDATFDQAGHVVDGSTTEHVVVTENWTFLRASGGHWLLSAIQQSR